MVCAVLVFVVCNRGDAAGKFKTPFAEIGLRAFGVKIQFAHAVGNQMAVELLFFAVVDAGAVYGVFAAYDIFDDAAVVARFLVGIQNF